jgi:hypothetical protein
MSKAIVAYLREYQSNLTASRDVTYMTVDGKLDRSIIEKNETASLNFREYQNRLDVFNSIITFLDALDNRPYPFYCLVGSGLSENPVATAYGQKGIGCWGDASESYPVTHDYTIFCNANGADPPAVVKQDVLLEDTAKYTAWNPRKYQCDSVENKYCDVSCACKGDWMGATCRTRVDSEPAKTRKKFRDFLLNEKGSAQSGSDSGGGTVEQVEGNVRIYCV